MKQSINKVTGLQVGFTTEWGVKALSETLDRIRITTVNGTDLFDAGTVNVSWEF